MMGNKGSHSRYLVQEVFPSRYITRPQDVDAVDCVTAGHLLSLFWNVNVGLAADPKGGAGEAATKKASGSRQDMLCSHLEAAWSC